MTSTAPGAPSLRHVDAGRLAEWQRAGVLHLPDLLDIGARTRLTEWIDEISSSDDPRLLRQREQTESGPVLARIEHFADVHGALGSLVAAGPVVDAGSELLGEPIVLYKEKINFKQPGGAGFTAHQDATAYPFIDQHVTCVIAVDAATPSNGCLEFAPGCHGTLLHGDGDGCLHPDVEGMLDWEPLEMAPGDVAWFHSRTPHRSADNHSDRPRRAIFLTFNAAAEGDRRSDYYAAKLARLTDHDDGDRSRVSTIGHFRGRAVTPRPTPTPTGGPS